MRLLLDEHFSPQVAIALRRAGNDVVAVAEREDLRGLDDRDLLVAARAERRVLVTEDIRDFSSLGERRLPSRVWHHGVVLTPRVTFRRSRRGYGHLIRALAQLLARYPTDDALVGDVTWLQPAKDPSDQPEPTEA